MSVSRQTTPEKAVLRADLRNARRAAGQTARVRHATRVQQILCEALPRLVPRVGTGEPVTLAAYVPVADEPGGPELARVLQAAAPAATLLLPVLRDDLDLDWAVYRGELVAAGRGLQEPSGPRLGVDAVATADLVVVPALAVDRRGTRLGRGGGSYDRALARVRPTVPVVALLHDGELCHGDLPAEPHDRPVTAVITPGEGLMALPRGGGDSAGEDGDSAREPGH